MSRKLDIDSRIDLWIPAFKAASNREQITCPRCGSNAVDVIAEDTGNGIGYVVITCSNCNKSGYFSRVDLKKYQGEYSKL